MKRTYLSKWVLTLLGSVLISLVLSCAQHHERVKSLEQNYQMAKNDPDISRNAPVALYETGQAIDKANAAKKDVDIDHWIYVGEKRLEIAREENKRKLAEDTAKNLQDEGQKAILSKREREAKDAKARASSAEAERDSTRRLAEQSQNEANQLRDERVQLTEKNKSLESQLTELKAKETERGLEVTLHDALFEFGKAELKPGNARVLDKLALVLKENPDRVALIEGHTDSIGSKQYNLQLSRARAAAVKDYLTDKGVPADHIRTKGFGETYPVASNKTDAGRQQNRRVEVVIMPQGKAAAEPSNNEQ